MSRGSWYRHSRLGGLLSWWKYDPPGRCHMHLMRHTGMGVVCTSSRRRVGRLARWCASQVKSFKVARICWLTWMRPVVASDKCLLEMAEESPGPRNCNYHGSEFAQGFSAIFVMEAAFVGDRLMLRLVTIAHNDVLVE